jgi:hypothetical protein
MMFPIVLYPQEQAYELEFIEIRGSISDNIYEEIDDFDYAFQDREPRINAYYIGSYVYLPGRIVFGSAISVEAFFRYTHDKLYHFLVGYHLTPSPEHAVHIVKLVGIGEDNITLGNVYFHNLPIVVKTYWIRIIQRTWKRVYREKTRVIQKRKSIQAIRMFEETGQYPAGIRNMPGIRGMLSY